MKTNENVKSSRIIFGIVAAVVVVFIVLLFCGVIPIKDWMQSNPNNLQTESVLKTETPIYNISVVFAGVIIAILFFYSVGAMVALFFLCITKRKGKDIVAEDMAHDSDKYYQDSNCCLLVSRKNDDLWMVIRKEKERENELIIFTSIPYGMDPDELEDIISFGLERVTMIDETNICVRKLSTAKFEDFQQYVFDFIFSQLEKMHDSYDSKKQIIESEEKNVFLTSDEKTVIFRHLGEKRLSIFILMHEDRSELQKELRQLEVGGKNIFRCNIWPFAAGFNTELNDIDWELVEPVIQNFFRKYFGENISFKNETMKNDIKSMIE